MKTFLGLLLCVAVCAAGHVGVGGDNTELNFVNVDFKERQLMILKLLNNILEPLVDTEIVDICRNFNIGQNVELYMKQDVVKQFLGYLNVGFLPRGEIFTLNVDRQLKEVVTLFHMLYYAKDFDTFIKTACWMRCNLNEGMFVYALNVAVRHREDCKGIILPPPYEVYPYYFVRADVIQKAYLLKMKKGLLDPTLCDLYGIKKTDKGVYIIDENIFDRRVTLNDEDRLRYFTEDIDLNTYYYYFHIDYPFWMKDDIVTGNKFMNRRFELNLYFYQQILARYYLERLSNGLGYIPTLDFTKTIRKGYWPWLVLHNGVQLPVRFNNQVINLNQNVEILNLVYVYENIIQEAILKGYVQVNGVRLELTKYDDVELLGKLIYGTIDKTDISKVTVDAYRYLLILMKSVIGLNTFNSNKYFVVPTVLDSYQTELRDPVFYQLQKRIIDFLILFKNRLPYYTREELYLPGVKIENVVVDKLVTYFSDYLMDISNAVVLNTDELKTTKSDMTILVRKRHLDNDPFKVVIDVQSDKSVDCVVRLFLGPKQDAFGRLLDINENRLNFVELDSFIYKLISGKNTIVRNSFDMHNIVHDRIMTRDLLKRIETITDVRDLFVKDLRNYVTGFPQRLILPKGRIGGLNLLLYVIITPLRLVDNVDLTVVDTTQCTTVNCDFRSTILLDRMPLGFPLDRRIDVGKFFTPNMKFVDVVVFHKQQTCDMKNHWNRFILRDYNLVDQTSVLLDNNNVNYGVNVDIDNYNLNNFNLKNNVNRNLNINNL